MKTDWEAAFKDLVEIVWRGNLVALEDVQAIKDKHTHKTDEDLPQKGIYWARRADTEWFMTWWQNGRIVGLRNPRIPNMYYGDSMVVWDRDRFSLEIGAEIIIPVGDKK